MTHLRRTSRIFLALFLLSLSLITATTASAQGGTVTGDKTIDVTDILCGGAVNVTLTLDAQTGIAGDPANIMLVLDRSGSMGGQPLADLKTAANTFVDILDEATDGTLDGVIANGSLVGVVSFAGSASLDQALTGNAAAVKSAINSLVASGLTNHEDAIQTAQANLPAGGNNIMIIFTDGDTTAGGSASDDAAAARAAGTEIYAIGLGSVNTGALNDWASDPDSAHVFVTPSSGDLQAIFEAIGAAIVVPAATNVTVVDTVNSHFSVSNVAASKGTAGEAANVITWTIDELGTETVTLTYTATHDPNQPGGVEAVNDSVSYVDDEGHTVNFPSPTVNVRGCPATLTLTPETETNELGTEDTTHTVTATVLDDFGDPVEGVLVDFAVTSGPNAGATGTCSANADCTTDANGEVSFTYTGAQGPGGIGTDVIEASFSNAAGVVVSSDTATKDWVDTTPPVTACVQTVNPNGNNVPKAPGNGGQGQNQDGFYELNAHDAVWPDEDIEIWVVDTGSGTEFGPFAVGTKIKYTEDADATPTQKLMGGPNSAIAWHIIGTGDMAIVAEDGSGNRSDPLLCLVPPPPQ